MKVLDIFSGAGGLSEGFRREGFDVIAHVEFDKAACCTLKTRESYLYLKAKNKLDIYYNYISGKIDQDTFYSKIPSKILNKVIEAEISSNSLNSIFEKVDKFNKQGVDILIGGPPCQAYSHIGRARDPKKMKKDPRNYLYKEYIKFLEHYNPNFFLFENVPGLYTAGDGKILDDIKKRFKKLSYNFDLKTLNAKDFGVAESRKRVIIIGWKNDLNFEYPTFDMIIPPKIINLFCDLPKIKAGESVTYKKVKKRNNLDLLLQMRILENEFEPITQHIARPHNDRDLEIYKIAVKEYNQNGSKIRYSSLPKHLITHKNTDSFLDRYKVVPSNEVSHTIVAHIGKDGNHFIHPDIRQNRSISVREAARIQSFPDSYFFETSRTAAFKQIGNAVPPLMAQALAKKIKEGIKKNIEGVKK